MKGKTVYTTEVKIHKIVVEVPTTVQKFITIKVSKN